jgi:hypothetical protein
MRDWRISTGTQSVTVVCDERRTWEKPFATQVIYAAWTELLLFRIHRFGFVVMLYAAS